MTLGLSDDSRAKAPNTLPWEQPGRLLEGHAGFDPLFTNNCSCGSGSGTGGGISRRAQSLMTTPTRGEEDYASSSSSSSSSSLSYGRHLRGRRPGDEDSHGDHNDRSGLNRRGMAYEYIRTHPGTHVRAMAKDLRFGTGDLQYHLFWLEKHGFVKTKKTGFYRHVYPTMVFQDDQEVLLSVLAQETPREIILSLLCEPKITQGNIARRLGHSQPSISWRMDRLLKLGMISKRRTSAGGGTIYEVVADRDDILNFVKSYHPEVWKKWAGRFTGVASSGEKPMDRVEGNMESADEVTGLMPPPVVEMIGRS